MLWSATLGAIPVKRLTCAASATFSYGSRGTPFWAKTLNRVPELPNAHDGSSMRWDRSAATTAWLLVTSASVAHRAGLLGCLVRPDRTRRAGRRSDPGGDTREWALEERTSIAPPPGSVRRQDCHTFRLVSITFLTIAFRYGILWPGTQTKPLRPVSPP